MTPAEEFSIPVVPAGQGSLKAMASKRLLKREAGQDTPSIRKGRDFDLRCQRASAEITMASIQPVKLPKPGSWLQGSQETMKRLTLLLVSLVPTELPSPAR